MCIYFAANVGKNFGTSTAVHLVEGVHPLNKSFTVS